MNDEQLYKTLTLARSLGMITTAHCENAELVAGLQKKLLAEGKTGPEWLTGAGRRWSKRKACIIS